MFKTQKIGNLQTVVSIWDAPSHITLNSEDSYHNFANDPLLLSCTLHRLIKNAKGDEQIVRCWSITEHAVKIYAKTMDEDYIFAEAVRSYYRSKLLVAKLRNENFTQYRTDLLQYLTDSPSSITSKFVGMIYKLPYFYEYDTKLTEIFEGEYADVTGSLRKRDNATLKFIAKVDNGKKRSLVHEYWFKDSDDNRVLVEVARNNPVLNLWDHTVNNSNINIDAKFETKRKDNLTYYVATGWSINVPEN